MDVIDLTVCWTRSHRRTFTAIVHRVVADLLNLLSQGAPNVLGGLSRLILILIVGYRDEFSKRTGLALNVARQMRGGDVREFIIILQASVIAVV